MSGTIEGFPRQYTVNSNLALWLQFVRSLLQTSHQSSDIKHIHLAHGLRVCRLLFDVYQIGRGLTPIIKREVIDSLSCISTCLGREVAMTLKLVRSQETDRLRN